MVQVVACLPTGLATSLNAGIDRRGANPHNLHRRKHHERDALAASGRTLSRTTKTHSAITKSLSASTKKPASLAGFLSLRRCITRLSAPFPRPAASHTTRSRHLIIQTPSSLTARLNSTQNCVAARLSLGQVESIHRTTRILNTLGGFQGRVPSSAFRR